MKNKSFINRILKKEEDLNLNSSDFKKLITKEFSPFLKKEGWLGSGFNYYKVNKDETTFVLSIQANKYGGSFCVDIGVHFNFLDIPSLDKTSKIRTYHTEINRRLTPNLEDEDYWWEYPKTNSQIKKLFENIKYSYKNSNLYFFSQYKNWEKKLTEIKIKDIDNNSLKIPFKTKIRAALTLSKINLHLKKYLNAKEISEYGITLINPPNGELLLPEFQKIIDISNKNLKIQ